jgi:hypothetical protein
MFGTTFALYPLIENYTADAEKEWDGQDNDVLLKGTLSSYGEDGHPNIA